jgi:hypothetical protein
VADYLDFLDMRSLFVEIADAYPVAKKTRAITNSLWDSAELEEGYVGNLDEEMARLSMVLSGDYGEELGVGEHAIAGLYYAIEGIRASDRGTFELVARNLYEAVDYNLVARPGLILHRHRPNGTYSNHPICSKC